MAETEYSLPVARQLRSAGQDEGLLSPMVRNSPAEAPPQPKGMAGGVEDDDDDDDCVILDSDPFSAVAVNDEKDGGSDEELQIVAEKGKVACRDFPHSRHLCSNMPFGATSHEKHCAMCYCFVCDAPAPCSHWGKGLSVGDHCHATDKETKWKMLREAFRCRNLPASHPETETAVHPAMVSLGRLFLSNQISLQDVVTQNRNTHTSVRASLSVAPIVNAPREGSGTGSAHTAQVTRLGEPTVSAPRAHPVAGAGRGTSSTHTAQISAPRAFSATGVGRSGTSSAHSAQVTRLVEPTVNAPRPHPEVGAGRGTSSTHTAQITHPVEPTVGAARAYSAARTGRGTSNAQSAQITRTVEQTVSAPRVYPAAGASSNAHSAQITYPATAGGYLPEPDAPEGATVYVGNLPYHIDNERLKLSFQGAGVVLFSKVIYDRETGQSRGFGFVTMSTVQEAEKAVRIYHGSGMYGRPLTVKIAAPRGGARVDAPRRQSGSPLRIFVCNLPSQVDNSRLEELFSKHGKVVDARVVYERREGASCSRGFGFVTMATDEESYKAIRALNKQILEGNALGVKVARERADPVCLPLSNRIPPQNAVSPNQHAHTSVGASLNVAPTVSAPRAYRITGARSSTSNASTAQVTHRLDPTVNAPRPGEYGMLPPPSS
ncbi:28 kDa ribonucleoprotein, chloroplastic [Triticum urartu]|nr:28 kDa ribonucleoprotein, chloroplastic [Triticum urartu]